MTIDITTIGIAVDSSGVVKGSKDLDRLGTSADKASRQTDKFSGSTKQASTSTTSLARSVGGLAAAYISLQSLRALGGLTDTYTKLNAQLRISARNNDEFKASFQDVVRISNAAQSSIEGTATLYARLANTLKDTNVTQQQFSNITESVALGLRVSGASAGEAQSAMLQLSQAFASGVLRGEEFNAVSEASFPLMKALADSMGIPIEQLRSMAMEGAITRDELVKAFSDPRLIETFRTQAKEMNTLGGAVQVAKNEFLLFVGLVAEKTGVVDIFTTAINAGSGALKTFNSYLKTGKINLDSFLPAYDKYRKKMDEEAKKQGLVVPEFRFAAKTGDAFSQAEIDAIAKFGTTIEVIPEAKPLTDAEQKALDRLNKQKSDDAKRLYDEKLKDIQDQFLKEDEFSREITAIRIKRLEEEDRLAVEALEKQYAIAKKWTDLQQKRALENYKEAQELNKKLEEERLREFEKTTDAINNIFREGFANLVNGGTSSWKAFTKSLFTTFKTAVADQIYKLFAQPFVVKLVASVLGIGASGAASASGLTASGGGIGNTLSSIGDIFKSGNASIVSSIESLGTFLSTGNGGLGDMLGGALGQYAGQIANVLPYAGAAFSLLSGDIKGGLLQGAGVAIGSAIGGPIGGAIGGALGSALGGMFGGSKLPPRFASGVVTKNDNGELTNETLSYKYKSAGGQDALASLNTQVIGVVGSLLSAYGLGRSLTQVGSVLNKKTNSSGGISAILDGQGFATNTGSIKKGTVDQAFSALAELALGSFSVELINKSKLPDGVKKFFDALVKKEDVIDATSTLISLKTALGDLPAVFDAVRNAIDTTSYNVGIEALKAQFAGTQQFVELFYTSTEKIDIFAKQLTTQFAALNLALPTSRDEFRKLVESFAVTDQATFDQRLALVSLSGAMDQYYNSLGDQLQVINQINAALGMDRFSKFSDFVIANAYSRKGLDIPAANMPSYAVGTSYVPSDGVAMLHQGEAVLTRGDNASLGRNTGAMVSLLNTLVGEVASLKAEVKRGADSAADSASDLDDIATGNVTIKTRAA